MTQAFISKGAKVVVGWTGLVDLSHTDRGLNRFLQEFLLNGKNVQQSVDATMRAFGPDPTFKSELSYYSLEQGGVVIMMPTSLLAAPSNRIQNRVPRF